MWEDVGGIVWAQVKALKPSFISKTPHFNFISAHCESQLLPSESTARARTARVPGHAPNPVPVPPFPPT